MPNFGKTISKIWEENMLIIFTVLGISVVIFLLLLIIAQSSLRIEILNLSLDISNFEKEGLVRDYLIYLRLYLFNKIRFVSIKIDDDKLVKFEQSGVLKWLDEKIGMKIEEEIKDFTNFLLKRGKTVFSKQFFKVIKELEIKISKFEFKLNIGTEDACITSFLTFIISSAISIILARNMEKFEKDKFSYLVTPLYSDKNLLKMDLNCIISTKTLHILNVIYRS
jgi:hypothetical protein